MAGDELARVGLTFDSKLLDEHVDPFLLDEDKLPLAQLIPRIIFEKGPFLNLTEEDLEKEIALEEKNAINADNNNDDNDDNDINDDQEHDDESTTENNTISNQSTNEEFFKNKAEVLKHVSAALNESSLSLDFVSLLISCLRPAAGTISMSAHLKKFVPPGSLNSDRVIKSTSQQQKEERFKEDKIIGQGWKLSSLENSSKNLRDASVRLSEEVWKEKLFWDTIKRNFNNKEILYKTRDKVTGKRIFAVKYGYEDSGSTYGVKGNAILKPTNDQQMEFEPINTKTGNLVKKILRIRILTRDEDSTIVGESNFDDYFKTDNSIRSQISKARYFIFEEELFNQLLEEATSLVAYNVRVDNESKISIDLTNEIIEIEFIDHNEEDEDKDMDGVLHERSEDSRANVIATYLRLMLTIKFKSNLESKNQPTIVKHAASQRLVNKPFQLILRPLVGQFSHDQHLQNLHELIKTLLKDLPDSSFKLKKFSSLKKEEVAQNSFIRISTPPVSTFTIKVSNSLKVIAVLDSFDFVNSVIHLKAYKLKTSSEGGQEKVIDVQFEELRQLEECLEWLIEPYKASSV